MSDVKFTQASGPLIPSPAKPASSPVAKSNGNGTQSDSESIAQVDVPKFVSPRFRLDPLLDTVILEFRDDQRGNVTKTVPTQAQLKLYALTNGEHKPQLPQPTAAAVPPSGPAATSADASTVAPASTAVAAGASSPPASASAPEEPAAPLPSVPTAAGAVRTAARA